MKDCCSEPGLMPVEEALATILETVNPIGETRFCLVQEALAEVLAEDQMAQVAVPPADNSAMDGYAIHSQDIGPGSQTALPVSQRIPAGIAPEPLKAGTAARIFTGAMVPAGADTVVMQEDCTLNDEAISFTSDKVKPGQHVRACGQDLMPGAIVTPAGRKLQAQDLGVLTSVGIAEVPVTRRLRVAILSTGDELVDPGTPLQAGQIYNSNRAMLHGLLQSLNIEVVDMGRAEDTFDATVAALQQAAKEADLVMTTGGVSVGEEDYVKIAVEELGQLNLWRLAIKPGKPLAYGSIAGVPFFGLPGNPGSVFVTFLIMARPYLLAMQGASHIEPTEVRAVAGFSVAKPGKRKEYCRARLDQGSDGVPRVMLYDNQSSGVLSSASWANGFAVIDVGQQIREGDLVTFIPFSSLFS